MGQGIEFEHSTWQEALEKAKESNKLLFVDAYTSWCGPCKKMAKYEFTKKEVGDYFNEYFVNLKLDMESKNGRAFDSKYPVSAYPTMLFIDGNGNVVKRIKGARPGSRLVKEAKAVMGGHDFSKKHKEQYDTGDRSYETVLRYVKSLNLSGKPSLKISNDYLQSDPKITEEQRLQFLAEAAVEADSKLFDQMLASKAQIIALIGNEQFDKKVRKACRKTVQKAIEFDFEELYKEANTKAEIAEIQDVELFNLESTKIYANGVSNTSLYEKSVEKLGNLVLKKDEERLYSLIDELINHPKKPLSEYTEKLAKKATKKYKSERSQVLFARIHIRNGKYDEAIKFLTKTLKKSEKPSPELEKYRRLANSLKNQK